MIKDITNDVDIDIALGKIKKAHRGLAIKHRAANLFKSLRRFVPYEIGAEYDTYTPSSTLTSWRESLSDKVCHCVDKLSSEQQELLRKRFIEGGTVRSISNEIGVSKSEVGRNVNYIRHFMHKCLHDSGWWRKN